MNRIKHVSIEAQKKEDILIYDIYYIRYIWYKKIIINL